MNRIAHIQSSKYEQEGTFNIAQDNVITANIQNFSSRAVQMVLGGVVRELPAANIVNGQIIPTSYIIETSPFPMRLSFVLTIQKGDVVVLDYAIISNSDTTC